MPTRAGVTGRLGRLLFPDLPAAGRGHIPSLDGLRAVAVLIVVLSHSGLGHIVPGGLGVTVFFFLSGYLITTLLRREYDRTARINFKNFYVRRSLRILPPCYLVVAGAVLATVVTVTPFSWWGVLANIGHYTNYYQYFDGRGGIPGLGVLWSLAVEEHYYLVFPILYWTLARYRPGAQAAALILICAAVLAWRCYLVFCLKTPANRTHLCSDTRLDSILWGSLLALAANPAFGDPAARFVSGRWAVAAAGLALLASLAIRHPGFRGTFRYTLQGVALTSLFASAVAHPNSIVGRVLNSYLFRLVGLYSYTIYLTHHIVLSFLERGEQYSWWVAVPIALGTSFVLAALMYRWVEKPMSLVKNSFVAGYSKNKA